MSPPVSPHLLWAATLGCTLGLVLSIGCGGQRADASAEPASAIAQARNLGLHSRVRPDFPNLECQDGPCVQDNTAPLRHNTPWSEGGCTHPRIEPNCQNGWCLVPAGCFIMGSPEDEFARSFPEEYQVPVWFTRPFHIQQHMFTYGEWMALGLDPPAPEPVVPDSFEACREPSCPLAFLNLFEAWMLANLVSETHSPPLPHCYGLSDCHGEIGKGAVCKSVHHTPSNLLDCSGFRLPTEYEWEYAARAGTRAPFYTNEPTPRCSLCSGLPLLDLVAWYGGNSEGRSHPVAQKLPNQWGLFDTIGNWFEWTNSCFNTIHCPYPVVDPGGAYVPCERHVGRGGDFSFWPSNLRVARRQDILLNTRSAGVRLVRTGAQTPGRLLNSPTTMESAVKD